MYELLNTINDPADLRKLDRRQLPQLAAELREPPLQLAIERVRALDRLVRGKHHVAGARRAFILQGERRAEIADVALRR